MKANESRLHHNWASVSEPHFTMLMCKPHTVHSWAVLIVDRSVTDVMSSDQKWHTLHSCTSHQY